MAPWFFKQTILFISLAQLLWSSSSALPSGKNSWIVRRQIQDDDPSLVVPEFEKSAVAVIYLNLK